MYLCCCLLLCAGDLKSSLFLQLISGGRIGVMPERTSLPDNFKHWAVVAFHWSVFIVGLTSVLLHRKRTQFSHPAQTSTPKTSEDNYSQLLKVLHFGMLLSLWVQTRHHTSSRRCLAWLMACLARSAMLKPHHPFPSSSCPICRLGSQGRITDFATCPHHASL